MLGYEYLDVYSEILEILDTCLRFFRFDVINWFGSNEREEGAGTVRNGDT